MARARSEPAEPAPALRSATRYGKLARNFLAAVARVGALDWRKV